jgi:hypothetical protein
MEIPSSPDSGSSAERTRAYRQRLRQQGLARAEQKPCISCGRLILASQITDPIRVASAGGTLLCAPCWRRSPDGKAAELQRRRQRRQQQQQQQGEG